MPTTVLFAIWILLLLAGGGALVWRGSSRRLKRALATVDIQNQAEDALEAGDYAVAAALFRQALQLGNQAKIGRRSNAAAAHWGLYRVAHVEGHWEAALRHCRKARSEAEGERARICGEIRQAAPGARLELLSLTGNWAAVEQSSRQLLSEGTTLIEPAQLHQYLGRACAHLGRAGQALPELERALALTDPADSGLGLLLHDLGVTQLRANLPEAAEETFRMVARFADESPETRHLTGRQAALRNAAYARERAAAYAVSARAS